MTENEAAINADQMRIKYGFLIVLSGFGLIGGVFVAAVLKWSTASDVATIIGPITGVVGTVVGAFFGVQIGAAGKEQAELARKNAEIKVQRLAAALAPDVAMKILDEI